MQDPADSYELETSIPVLRMLDETATRDFYVHFLGYSIDWEHRFSPELPNSPLYMQISLGGSKIHLNGHAEADAPTAEVRIPVRNLAAYCRTLQQRAPKGEGPEVVDPRYEGIDTDMNIYDPSGNMLVFWRPNNKQ